LRAAAARKLLNFVPTHELAVRTLMTAFAEMDDHAQAIREFERFRVVLTTSLGIPPATRTVAVYEAVLLESRARARRPAQWSGPGARAAGQPTEQYGEPVAAEASSQSSIRDLMPSIAVLPFRNLSGDPSHDFVADGLVEDLVEALSRVPSLFVISRLSAAAFRKRDRTPAEIAEALRVRYLLAGSMRLLDGRLRLVVELTEADNGKLLWVSRFDARFTLVLDLQAELADAVARQVVPHLRAAELERVRIKRPEDYTAYDFFLRGQEAMHNPSRAVFDSARSMLEAAVTREPRYATALAWLVHWRVLRVGQGWSPDPAEDTGQADHLAKRALECDPTDPMALAIHGHVAGYLHRDFDLALARLETASRINPNSPRAWLWSAYVNAWTGNGPSAVAHINKAIALSPYDPLEWAYSSCASVAYLADGQYERAIEFALRSIRENEGYTTAHKALILGLTLADRRAEARTLVPRLLLLEPGFTVERFRRKSPAGTGKIGELFCDALARAGVPLLS